MHQEFSIVALDVLNELVVGGSAVQAIRPVDFRSSHRHGFLLGVFFKARCSVAQVFKPGVLFASIPNLSFSRLVYACQR